MPMRAGRQATWLVALLAAGSLYSSGEDRLRCDEGAAGLASLSPSARMASPPANPSARSTPFTGHSKSTLVPLRLVGVLRALSSPMGGIRRPFRTSNAFAGRTL